MNIISLFDGIGCGREALERIGIKPDSYYASEIEKHSMKIATANHPDITEIGDVRNISYSRASGTIHTEDGGFAVGKIDLLMGGSPCTDFSSIGNANGMKADEESVTTLERYTELKDGGFEFSGQSYLFWEYMRILKETEPRFFLLENVVMAKQWQQVLTDAIGVEPIAINSSLVSAQNRPRLYWTNIPGVQQPQDRNITLSGILCDDAPKSDVSKCKTVQKCFDRLNDKHGYIPEMFNAYNASEIKDKACALSRGSMVTSSCATLIFTRYEKGKHEAKDGILNGRYRTKLADGRYNIRKLSITEMERLQTLPDGYTDIEGVSDNKKCEAMGNGWTVDVIAHILSYIGNQG